MFLPPFSGSKKPALFAPPHPPICNKSPNHLFPHTWALKLRKGATLALCHQFLHSTHAPTCSSGLFYHTAVFLPLPKFQYSSLSSYWMDNLVIPLGVQLLMLNASLSHSNVLYTWLGFETTNWLALMRKYFHLTQALKSFSGKPSYAGIFLMLFVLTCHARPPLNGLLDLQRFWYLVQICHSRKTLPSSSLGSHGHVVALIVLYRLWHLLSHMDA